MNTSFLLAAVMLLSAALICVLYKNKKLSKDIVSEHQKAKRWMISCACNEDNLNYMSDRLSRFAANIFGRSIPKYSDGTDYRPGDIVEFVTVIGDRHYVGEIEVNLDDEGQMTDRCTLNVRTIPGCQNEQDRSFQLEQVKDIVLCHRPERFEELVEMKVITKDFKK